VTHRPGHARAQRADTDADLAACRSGQELTESDEIGIGLVVEPSARADVFLPEIPEMRDGATERNETELERDPSYLERAGEP